MSLDISSYSLHLFPGLDDTEKIPGMSFLACEMCLNRKWYDARQLVIWLDMNKTMDSGQWNSPALHKMTTWYCKLNFLLSDEHVSLGLLFLKLSF